MLPALAPALLHGVMADEGLSQEELATVRDAGSAAPPDGLLMAATLLSVYEGVLAYCGGEDRGGCPLQISAGVAVHRGRKIVDEFAANYVSAWLAAMSFSARSEINHSSAQQYSLESIDCTLLVLVADGRSNEQIASELAYSVQAIRWRLGRLMKRWTAPNRAALVATAFGRGVLCSRSCERTPLPANPRA